MSRGRSNTVQDFGQLVKLAGLLTLSVSRTPVRDTERASSDAGDKPTLADEDMRAFPRWRNGEVVVHYVHNDVARTWHGYAPELIRFSARSARVGTWQFDCLAAICEAVNAARLSVARRTNVLRPLYLKGREKAYLEIRVDGRYWPVGQ